MGALHVFASSTIKSKKSAGEVAHQVGKCVVVYMASVELLYDVSPISLSLFSLKRWPRVLK